MILTLLRSSGERGACVATAAIPATTSPHELDTVAHTQASAGPTGPFSCTRPSCLIVCLAFVVPCSPPLELITIATRVNKNRQHHQPSVAYTRRRANCFSPVADGAHAASRAFKIQKIQLVLKKRVHGNTVASV
jgi:hypothetical protein